MTKNLAASRAVRILAIPFGLCFVALGAVALLSVLGIVKSSAPPTLAYQVFGLCAAAVFIAAGMGITLFGLGFTRIAAKAGGVALLFFVLAFNWVAFGPGERQFTSKTSSVVSAATVRPASELEGRLVFGVIALLMDAVVVYGFVKGRNKN
jgi:hypothetical protein